MQNASSSFCGEPCAWKLCGLPQREKLAHIHIHARTNTRTQHSRERNKRTPSSFSAFRFSNPLLLPSPRLASCVHARIIPAAVPRRALLRIPDRYPQKSMAMVGKNSSRFGSRVLENSRRGEEGRERGRRGREAEGVFGIRR